MSKKFLVEEMDKETRIRKQEMKRKSKKKEKFKEDIFERKAKSKKRNKINFIRVSELYDEFEYYDDESEY